MPRKLTHEEFLDKFNKVNTHAKDIEILGTYKNSQTKILCRCKIDGYEWEVKPNTLLTQGTGCPKCVKRVLISTEEFIQQLAQINPNIEVLGTYKGTNNKIKCKCKVDGYEWEAFVSNLLKGSGCPICGNKRSAKKQSKSHKYFIEQMKQINPNIIILGDYNSAHSKILCKCKVCEHEWSATPANLLHGNGCPQCKFKKQSINQTKSHQQFIQEMRHINKDIKIIGTYVKGNVPIKCKCKICGHEWKPFASSLLQGFGCPMCARKTISNKMTKSHEQFIQELQQINTDVDIIGTYVNGHTKIKTKCKICGYEWNAVPQNLLKGSGCPKCVGKYRTHEEFIQLMTEVNPNIQILDTFINASTKIKCKCKVDGNIWEALPQNLLHGTGCPKCAIKKVSEKQRKTHEQFMEELQQINQDIEIIGTYINNSTKIKCKCKVCAYVWEAFPGNLLSGSGCSKCNISKGEKRVAQYLDNLGIDYIYNKKYFKDLVGIGGRLLRPDFIIPSLKLWIEYDGEQHFRPVDFTSKRSEQEVQQQFKNTQQNDQIKNQYAEQHNWTLIRIPYWDYDNIEQILDSYLKQEEELAL